MEKKQITLRRLDAEGGEVTLEATHAKRLMALEARMGVKNFEPTTPDADDSQNPGAAPETAERGRAGKGGKGQ